MKQEEFIKRYTYDPVTDQLGKGGFGSVFKAYDNYEHEYVALKIQGVDPRHPELRLKNEVDKAARLEHVNIARYDKCLSFRLLAGEVDIAVMQYYENGSLSNIMDSGMLDAEHRYDILTQILEGLSYLHFEGIIHRDLKPQNVLIARRGNRYIPKITDFGISKQLDEGQSSAVSNSVLGGTRAYASPEQLKDSTIRKNTDLWSFGVIAYQMLVGALPFDCGSFSPTSEEGRQEQFRQMMSGLLPDAVATIPEPWQRLIRECLTVDRRIVHAEDCLAIIRGEEATTVALEVDNPATQLDGDSEKAVEPEPSSEPKPMPKSKSLWEQLRDLGFKMIYVKGGAFCMAYVKRKWYQRDLSYEVNLSDFAISETPITQAQWEAVMGTTLRQQHDLADTSWSLRGEGPNNPMYCVNYDEAKEFCRRLSVATGRIYTLPTEAQWEFAARGGQRANGTIFTYSGSNSIDDVAWYTDNSSGQTHPVKQKSANQLGLYDMSGNVWEWCLDWYAAYPLSKVGHYIRNPQGPSSGKCRVLRGGSCCNNASACRVANRGNYAPSNRYSGGGFRVVCLP